MELKSCQGRRTRTCHSSYDLCSSVFMLTGWRRVQCFGHRLNLAVTKALKDGKETTSNSDVPLKTTLKDMKKILAHFSHSHKKKRALREAQVSR